MNSPADTVQANNTLQKIPMLGAVAWLMLQQSALRTGFPGDLEAASRWRQPPHRLALQDWSSGQLVPLPERSPE